MSAAPGEIRAAKQSIEVNSTSEGGYHVTLTTSGASTSMTTDDGKLAIDAITGANDSPKPLTDGSWGYALPGKYGFNLNYEAEPDRESKWARLPVVGTDNRIMERQEPSSDSGEHQDVWFAVRPSMQNPAGNYSIDVVYTMTADEPAAPELVSVTPESYNLGDETATNAVTLRGLNLASTYKVFVDLDRDIKLDNGEECDQTADPTNNTLKVDMPNSNSIKTGTYDIYAQTRAGRAMLLSSFTYKRQTLVTDISPNRYNLKGDRPTMMVGAQYHQMVLTRSGEVFAWGQNSHGQLGTGDLKTQSDPTSITNQFALGDKVVQVSALGWHSLALTESGRVYSWGANDYGQVGNSTTIDVKNPMDITDRLKLPAGHHVVKIYAGYDNSYALTNRGEVYAWGKNIYGQIATGDRKNVLAPRKIDYDFKGSVINIVADSNVLALTDSGHLYTWGWNCDGQIGDGTHDDALTPVDITEKIPGEIKQIGTGSNSSFVVTESNKVYAWGYNPYGNLGFGDDTAPLEPTEVKLDLGKDKLDQLATGYYYSMALGKSGKVYVWGQNNAGQLGLGSSDSTEHHASPVELKALRDKVDKIWATGNALFAMNSATGDTYSWGRGATPRNISSLINYSLITIKGTELAGADSVYVDLNSNGVSDDGEACRNIKATATRINCTIPNNLPSLKPGQYDVYVVVDKNTLRIAKGLTYYDEE